MSYTPPKNTVLTGDVTAVTASEGDADTSIATTGFVNRAVGNASTARPACRVYNSTTQSLTNNTITALNANTETFDTDSMHSTSSNTDRITAPTTGTYIVTAHVEFAASAAGSERLVGFETNAGGTYYGVNESGVGDGSGTDNTSISTSAIVQLNAGDYVRVHARQRSGGALNVTLASFAMAWIGGTGSAWGNAGASSTKSGNQSIATTTWTSLTFDADTFDIDGMHSTASNTERFTCVTPGTYIFTGFVAWAANSAGIRSCRIRHSGGQDIALVEQDVDSATSHTLQVVSVPVQMAVGEYVTFDVYQTSGGALNALGGYCKFGGLRVGYQTNPADLPGTYIAGMYAANSGAPTNTSNGAWQKVGSGGGTLTWTSEFDKRPSGVSAQVDTATNKRIDIRKTGLYRVRCGMYFNTISDGKIVGVQIRKNASATPIATDLRTIGVASGDTSPQADRIVSLTSGDYLELYAFQNDSASETYAVSYPACTYIQAEYLGPAS